MGNVSSCLLFANVSLPILKVKAGSILYAMMGFFNTSALYKLAYFYKEQQWLFNSTGHAMVALIVINKIIYYVEDIVILVGNKNSSISLLFFVGSSDGKIGIIDRITQGCQEWNTILLYCHNC